LLVEKGIVASDALDKLVDIYENDLGPMNGAQVVAHAWVDPEFKKRLLENATPEVHNVVVCSLCSCYPWPVLGLPPTWYKSAAYRSRVVIDPRSVLAEFGTELDDSVEVRVWDSSAEVRYLVIPERPAGGTEDLSEQELAELVSRDAMIGVSKVSAP
jgi:nitrile hydratase